MDQLEAELKIAHKEFTDMVIRALNGKCEFDEHLSRRRIELAMQLETLDPKRYKQGKHG